MLSVLEKSKFLTHRHLKVSTTFSLCKCSFLDELFTCVYVFFFIAIDSYSLPTNEVVQSLAVAKFSAYPNQEYLFVGTIIEKEDDPDHDTGRILVFDFKENSQCELLDQVSVPGVVYSMKAFQNSMVASVNGSVSIATKNIK